VRIEDDAVGAAQGRISVEGIGTALNERDGL
jgi:hypothetical protein